VRSLATTLNEPDRSGAEELLWPQADLVCPAVPLAEILSGVDPIYHLSWSTIPADSILSPSEDARAACISSK
jgi:hypothetical protein